MASTTTTIRGAILAGIQSAKDAESYIRNNFDLDETYLPYESLPKMSSGGHVWIISLGFDDAPKQSRTSMADRIHPVQVALVHKVNPHDNTTCNELVELYEQLSDTCRKLSAEGYTWLRNEALRPDENQLPYSFQHFKDGSVFLAVFTAYYKTIIE
jgi:hypothetical protein